MRPLSLDYRRGSLIQHRIGMGVLALALMVIVAMGGYYRNLTGQSARLELQVAKVGQKLHRGACARRCRRQPMRSRPVSRSRLPTR